MPRIEPVGDGAYNFIEDDPWYVKFGAGLKRGALDIGQGAKQKYLMAVGDEDEAEAYTDEINRQVAEFEAKYPGIGPESVGRFLSWAAPGLIPGLGVGGRIGLAATEGLLAITEKPEWAQAGFNAAIGAGLGAAGEGAAATLRGLDPAASKLTDEAKEAVQYMQGKGLTLRPQDIRRGPAHTVAGNVADQAMVPGVLGRSSAQKTVDTAEEHAADLVAGWRGPDATAWEGMRRQISEISQQEGRAYDEAFRRVGNATVDADAFLGDAMDMLEGLAGQGGRSPASLQTVWRVLEDSMPTSNRVEDWRKFRTNLRESENMLRREGINVEPLWGVYDLITRYTDDAARKVDPQGADILAEANELTKTRHRIEDSLLKSEEGPAKLAKKLLKADADDAARILKELDPQARQAAVYGIYAQAMEQATGGGRAGGFSPRAFASVLEKAKGTLSTVMDDAQQQSLDGLIAYMNTAGNAFNQIANPQTGARSAQLALSGGPLAAYAATGNPGPLMLYGITQAVIPMMMRNQTFGALARRLAQEQAGTPRHQLLVAEMDRLIQQAMQQGLTGAATSPDPLQVPIYNGRPQ